MRKDVVASTDTRKVKAKGDDKRHHVRKPDVMLAGQNLLQKFTLAHPVPSRLDLLGLQYTTNKLRCKEIAPITAIADLALANTRLEGIMWMAMQKLSFAA